MLEPTLEHDAHVESDHLEKMASHERNKASECEKCKAWKKVLTQTFGLNVTELLEGRVEKELSSRKKDL